MVWRMFYHTYKINELETESNRQKHFWYAIPCGFLLTILFVAGLAAGMEFKVSLTETSGTGLISWLRSWVVW